MKRILVAGLKQPIGGVENAVLEYIRCLNPREVCVDLVVRGADDRFGQAVEPFSGRVLCMPSRVRHPKAYRRFLNELFSQNEYDAVWYHVSGLTNIDILQKAALAGVPMRVCHAHTAAYAWGNVLMRYIVPLLHCKNKRVITRYATDLWACSLSAARFMFDNETARIIPNAVNTSYFAFDETARATVRRQYGIGDAPLLLHIGRMCTAKNQKFLLDIFSSVRDRNPAARLLFVGDGELSAEIHAYAKSRGLTDAVIFTGALSDVHSLYSAADVFLLPSLTEGFPVTLVEAQAAGLPCVVSREAVPQTANITGAVTYVSLQTSPREWAECILSVVGTRTENAHRMVADAGYDSAIGALEIKRFFCRKQAAVVTFPRACNYGTALQALAMQKALEARGACAYFADHTCEKIAQEDMLLDMHRCTDVRYMAAHLLNFPTAYRRQKRFADFCRRYMWFADERLPRADVAVAGSDQIWNEKITGNDTYYYLDLPREDLRKSAYAASFGVTDVDAEQIEHICRYLSPIEHLSVREQQAADILERHLHRTVPVVADPTLLLQPREWEQFADPTTANEPYIFVYTVFNSESLWDFAYRLSQETGLPIRTMSYSTLHKHRAAYTYTAGPAQWLAQMRDAHYVVTNSFHGVAFSINLQKEFFYELPPERSGVQSRIENITAHYGVQHRRVGLADIHERVQWDTMQPLLDADRREAAAFMDKILDF